MIRNKSSLRSSKAHLIIQSYPWKEIIICSRRVRVSFRLQNWDVMPWKDFPGWVYYMGITLPSEKSHEVMIFVKLLVVRIEWWRRNWLGWRLSRKNYLSLYDEKGKLQKFRYLHDPKKSIEKN